MPFGRRELAAMHDAAVAFLSREGVAGPPERLRAAVLEEEGRATAARRRFGREAPLRARLADLLAAVGRPAPDDAAVGRYGAAIEAAFASVARLGDGAAETVAAVRAAGRRAGLVSNFVYAPAIHAAVEALGLAGDLDAVVVSGEFGLAKPAPEIFRHAAERIGLDPREILFVGDRLAIDVGGAAAVGMAAAWVRQHHAGAYEPPGETSGGAAPAPDLVLDRLADLIPHLGS